MTSNNSSPEERLVGADPAAGKIYAHGDMSAMLARVTSTERVAKVRFAEGFRLKMGSAAAAAALVTAGGIAALGAVAPSLSVLALGQTHSMTGAIADSSTIPGAMKLWGTDHFIAGPGLSSGSSSAPAYIVTAPSDLAAASQQIASALSITGTPSETPSLQSSWTIGTGTNQVSFYVSQGVLNWNLVLTPTVSSPGSVGSSGSGTTDTTVPTTTPATTDAPTLSNDQALSSAQQILNALGVSDQLGTPVYSNYADTYNNVNQTTVQIPWLPSGIDTGLSFWFTFDGSGTLLYANGQTATVSAGGIYPLLSEVDAVAVLQSQQGQFSPMMRDSVGPSGASSSDVTTTTSTSSGSTVDSVPVTGTVPVTDTTPGTVPSPPVRDVTLVSAQIQYGLYTLSDGSSALLAQYAFTSDDGSVWTVLAVDPHYVSLDSSATPMVY